MIRLNEELASSIPTPPTGKICIFLDDSSGLLRIKNSSGIVADFATTATQIKGTAVLVAGTVTIAEAAVDSSSIIILTSQLDGGTPGFLRVSARTDGVNFTITSSDPADTSTVGYVIYN